MLSPNQQNPFFIPCQIFLLLLTNYENSICHAPTGHKSKLNVINFYNLSHSPFNHSFQHLHCMLQQLNAPVWATCQGIVEDFGRASLFCPVLSYRLSDDVTEYGTSGNFRFCMNMDDPWSSLRWAPPGPILCSWPMPLTSLDPDGRPLSAPWRGAARLSLNLGSFCSSCLLWTRIMFTRHIPPPPLSTPW